jgi:hypothetical protein
MGAMRAFAPRGLYFSRAFTAPSGWPDVMGMPGDELPRLAGCRPNIRKASSNGRCIRCIGDYIVTHDNHEVAMSPCDLDVLSVRGVSNQAFLKQIQDLVFVENAIDGRIDHQLIGPQKSQPVDVLGEESLSALLLEFFDLLLPVCLVTTHGDWRFDSLRCSVERLPIMAPVWGSRGAMCD